MEELYKRADRYSMLEDNICATTQTVMIISQLVEGNTLVGKKLSRFKEGQGRDLKQSHDQSQKKKKKKKSSCSSPPLTSLMRGHYISFVTCQSLNGMHRSRWIPPKEINPWGEIIIEIMGMRPRGAKA